MKNKIFARLVSLMSAAAVSVSSLCLPVCVYAEEAAINKTEITPQMTYVDYHDSDKLGEGQADVSFGYVDTALTGYNKFDGTIGWGNTKWKVNKVAFLKVDASAVTDKSIAEATLSLDVSGSTDSKRKTSYGAYYTPYTDWNETLTYNIANANGMMSGKGVDKEYPSESKSASQFNTITIDITDALITDEDRIATIGIYETAAAGGYIKNPKVTITSSSAEVYTVTYTVDGVTTSEPVVENKTAAQIPQTDKEGYIFLGWQQEGADRISTEELAALAITSNMTFTAVYEKDPDYIEPIKSVSIKGPKVMEIGADPDTAAQNEYSVAIEGNLGTDLAANPDERANMNIEWEFLGFKTENDNENQYCDSYGEVVYPEEGIKTKAVFSLKGMAFNFYGEIRAKINYNGTVHETKLCAAILGDKSMPTNQILPKAGYPSDFDAYSDSMVGYRVIKDTNGVGNDTVTGGWSVAGSDSAAAEIMSEDGNKFIRMSCPTSSKSHMLANVIDTPMTQAIFEQDMRFNNANAHITLTSKYPFYNSSYTNPVTLLFTGSTLTLNGTPLKLNERDADIQTGKWYKIVLSVDKTNETCFAKAYTSDGELAGETESVKWTQTSMPTFYSIGFPNSNTGTVDFDNYKAYYPKADASSYELIASQQTLSIPNKETAVLSASVKTAEGYDITGDAVWTVVEEDMKEGVIITPDENDSHKATVSLGEGASAGDATIQVNIGGLTKTIVMSITDSAESVKFTSSRTSISIPIDDTSTETAQFGAIVINGDGADMQKPVTLELYDKSNTNKYTLPQGITFDSEAGTLTVTSKAVPCTFTVRATGENSKNEAISKSVRVTVHGLSFDFGSGDEGSLPEGYTEVTPNTAYTAARGYGIEGTAAAAGTASDTDPKADYLEGSFVFKVNVTKGELYKVTVNFSGDLVTERVNDYLTGHERTLPAEATSHTGYTVRTDSITEQVYLVPVVDDVLDMTFTNAKAASVMIEKVERTKAEKPSIYSVGDSTLGNNGSYGYTLVNNLAKYPELNEVAAYHNNGKGSRNLQTYYTQGWLDGVLSSIRPGDIVTVGNMGTNPGGLSGSQFKAPLDYYVDACLAMGAKVILTSYTPHGCVSGYEYVYDKTTHTFHGCRQDGYDSLGIRVIYQERLADDRILGFIDIGKMADDAFTAYTADYAKHGYATADDAAKAIISCFPDHNHYNKGTIACELMLDGYEGVADGIVKQLTDIISGKTSKKTKTVYEKNAVVITAEYNADGTLKQVHSVESVKAGDVQITSDAQNTKVFAWDSLDGMQPVGTKTVIDTGI